MELLDYGFIILMGLLLICSIINLNWKLLIHYGIKGIFSWEKRIRLEIGIEERIWEGLELQEKELIRDIFLNARLNDVKFNLSNEEKIHYPNGSEFFVSGYFLGDENENYPELGIAVGGKKEDWLPVLLHESCHMDQWVERSAVWALSYIGGKDIYDMLDEWINGKEFIQWEIDKIIKNCIEIELDCEKRVLDKIIKNKLSGINQYEYIQKANSYVMFYCAILKNRKWYDNAPYKDENVWGEMPSRFLDKEEYFNCREEYLNLYNKFCYT